MNRNESTESRVARRLFALTILAALLFLPLSHPGPSSASGMQQGRGEPLASLMSYGQTVFGSLGAPGQTQEYSFQASAGDLILVRASRATGDLWPRIRLNDPSGLLLGDEESPVHVEFTVKTGRSGTHRIRISDGFDQEGVGTYRLYLQRLNGAAAATPLLLGQTVGGSITQEAEMDAYSFSAEEGDIILTRLADDEGDLWPELRLYDPAGTLLNSKHDPSHAEFTTILPTKFYAYLPMILSAHQSLTSRTAGTASPASYKATVSGTYTVLVGDGFNGTLVGPYGLYVQRLDGPGNANGLSFGAVHSSRIDQAAEMDTYTFEGSVGDRVLVSIGRVSGDLHAEIRLYDPAGSLINTTEDAFYAEATTSLIANGTYTLLVGDGFWGRGTGEYNLYLQRLNNPGNATPLSYGEILSGTILYAAEIDTYTFSAEGGDQVRLGMSRASSGSLWPEVRLYAPDGALIATDDDSTSAEITRILAESGTYTVLCTDGLQGSSTGEYDLQLDKLSTR